MREFYYVASDGVLGLHTNSPNVKWSWGINMPETTLQEYEQCTVRIRYTVLPETPIGPDPHSHGFGKYHYFHGRPGADEIYYRRDFVGNRELYFRLSGLVSDEIHLEVSPNYARFITHRFMNLHSAGYILTDVVGWALVRHGFAPVHCSGFSMEAKTVMVLAPPNTGKTLTAMTACMEYDAGFLAEDVAITDGNAIFGVPWTSTFRYYEHLEESRRTKAVNRLMKVFPPAELLPVAKSSRIDQLLSESQIVPSGDITHVAVLERHDHEQIVPILQPECVSKAINLNRYEFKYSLSPAMVAYEYFNPGIDLTGTQTEEFRILAGAIDHAEETFVVGARNASRYASMIVSHLTP